MKKGVCATLGPVAEPSQETLRKPPCGIATADPPAADEMARVKAPVVAFEDTEDCRFVGNRITDCDVDGLIAFEGAPKDNVRVESRDNLLRNNRVKGVAVKDSP